MFGYCLAMRSTRPHPITELLAELSDGDALAVVEAGLVRLRDTTFAGGISDDALRS